MSRHILTLLISVSGLAVSALAPAHAETMAQALASAYANNPQINAARAGLRATDEYVPQAKAALRPQISAYTTGTANTTRTQSPSTSGVPVTANTFQYSNGLQATQTLFQGFRNRNAINEADANVLSSRASLENTVQTVLYDAAQSYLNVVYDQAVLQLNRNDVTYLQRELQAAEDQFKVGESTRTDVAQARSQLSTAISNVSSAEATLKQDQATYRQLVGHDPVNLRSEFPFESRLPRSVSEAANVAIKEHPSVLSASYAVDAANFAVKQAEGLLLPTITLQGTAEHTGGSVNELGQSSHQFTNEAQVVGQISIPLYAGGAYASQIRQAKETLGQRKIQVDQARDQVRQAAVASFGNLAAAKASITAATAAVQAEQIAVSGVEEEQKVGQRTLLDVLDERQNLLNAQVQVVSGQRNRGLASLALLQATGRLGLDHLNLPATAYKPQSHYQAVKDKWGGLRTPDGR